MRSPYPLQWPPNQARTLPANRVKSKFDHPTLHQAALFVLDELRKMKARAIVITSDFPTRRDDIPYEARISEIGFAVWFDLNGFEKVLGCDAFLTAADNLWAIGKTIEALRGIGRWGVAGATERAMHGFQALPPGADASGTQAPQWRDVIGGAWPPVSVGKQFVLELAEERYRKAIRAEHPDAGGTAERAASLNLAIEEARKELA